MAPQPASLSYTLLFFLALVVVWQQNHDESRRAEPREVSAIAGIHRPPSRVLYVLKVGYWLMRWLGGHSVAD